MQRALQKLDHGNFTARRKRVDPFYAKHGFCRPRRSNPNAHPILATLFGFGWIYFVISVAQNRGHFEQSLLQGTLDSRYHDEIIIGLTLLVTLSVVAIGVHAFRFLLRRRGERGASGSILVGALGALMLAGTPAEVLTGPDGLGSTANALLASLDDPAPTMGIDAGSVALVSSSLE